MECTFPVQTDDSPKLTLTLKPVNLNFLYAMNWDPNHVEVQSVHQFFLCSEDHQPCGWGLCPLPFGREEGFKIQYSQPFLGLQL